MTHLSSWSLASILTFLSALHIYWAIGGKTWLEGTLPRVKGTDQALFRPGPLTTLIVATLLAFGTTLALWRAGIVDLPGPPWIPRVGVWALAAAFALRAIGDFRYDGFFKKPSPSTFARRDSRIYSPLCVVIAVLAVAVGLG